MIKDYYNDLVACASLLGDYSNLTKSDLANKYCDAEEINDTRNQERYLSALMVSYWYMIPQLKNRSKGLRYDYEDYASMLYESLMLAFKYKRWRDPSSKLYDDPKGAEKAINRCIETVRCRHLEYVNYTARKLNGEVYSLDTLIEELGDTVQNLYVEDSYDIDCREIVQNYINKNDIFSALVVDGIAYQDKSTVIKHLQSITDEYLNYFKDHYVVDTDKLLLTLGKIKKATRRTLYRYIETTMCKLKTDERILSLCS